jgi:carbon-monoxide dehydrogenase large subunit
MSRPADWKPRIEDAALLRGAGQFGDDTPAAGQVAAVFVRSPHAHARIRAIDTAAARALPGVLAVLTAGDMTAAGAGSVSQPVPQAGREGRKLVVPRHPPLADGRAMYVGQPVALVIAATLADAQDAAEAVAIDYDPLPAVVDLKEAISAGAPQLWPEAPGNLALDWPAPHPDPDANGAEVVRRFAGAAHVARVSLVNQRIVVASMETRSATARYDAATDRYLLRAPTQGARMVRDQLLAVFGWPADRLRLVTGDVGGGFGMKSAAYDEYAALLVAARVVGRPVHWTSTRTEAFLSDKQARDNITDAELALDSDGSFLALKVSAIASMGAFLASHGAFIASANFARCFPTVYDIAAIDVDVRCIFTNTVPIGPYRGAGRPEANYAMERLVDEAARVSGIDGLTLRRRNLIPRERMPYKGAMGTTYDSGDFAAVLDKALDAADVAGFAARRRHSEHTGKRRGLGISCYLEHAGGAPGDETALNFPEGGRIELDLAMHGSGQGHASLFRRLAAARLGIAEHLIAVRQGDTELGLMPSGAIASRSTTTAGAALVRTVEQVLEKGRRVASALLEAAEPDIDYAAGAFFVTGTDRRVSLFEVADRARVGEPLDTKGRAEVPQTFPNGCHVAEVEIDPDTGTVVLVAFTAVDDCGTPLDPVLVDGQVQGGLAQGIGQALCEDAVFDRATGQLLAGSFMDYAMPRADLLPELRTLSHPVPCTTNPLGVKGTGEAGTTGALAAVMNAIANALPRGAALDMPATPEKVWRACRNPR